MKATRAVDKLVDERPTFDVEAARKAATELLRATGADLTDESIQDTPQRIACLLQDMLTPEPVDLTTFPNDGYDELVLVRDIPFSSLCAHHLLPFTGIAHVAYMPNERILGLSKLARIVEFYAHSLQLQEKLTIEVADCIETHVQPKGVGVVLAAEHNCMTLRGANAHGSQAITSAVRGQVRNSEKLRAEFFSLVNAR